MPYTSTPCPLLICTLHQGRGLDKVLKYVSTLHQDKYFPKSSRLTHVPGEIVAWQPEISPRWSSTKTVRSDNSPLIVNSCGDFLAIKQKGCVHTKSCVPRAQLL